MAKRQNNRQNKPPEPSANGKGKRGAKKSSKPKGKPKGKPVAPPAPDERPNTAPDPTELTTEPTAEPSTVSGSPVYPVIETMGEVFRRRPGYRKSRLETMPEPLYAEMLQYIRAGAFDHTAAEVVGVNKSTYWRWLAKGKKHPNSVFGQFYRDVMQARATPKIIAESRVFNEQPLAWLRLGPGKADWSEQSKISLDHSGSIEGGDTRGVPQVNLHLHADALSVLEECGIISRIENVSEGPKLTGPPANGNGHSNGDDVIDL